MMNSDTLIKKALQFGQPPRLPNMLQPKDGKSQDSGKGAAHQPAGASGWRATFQELVLLMDSHWKLQYDL